MNLPKRGDIGLFEMAGTGELVPCIILKSRHSDYPDSLDIRYWWAGHRNYLGAEGPLNRDGFIPLGVNLEEFKINLEEL